ncbi:MAG: hypothetical protein RLZZ324_557 [Candidatus Parcubacteria bacterium]
MKVHPDDLDRPLTALLVAPGAYVREQILSGGQTATVRFGLRDYKPGERVMLCCHLEPFAVQALVQRVRHCTVRQLKPDQLARCGYASAAELLDSLRPFYPAITRDSKVTYIAWKDIAGKLVDDRSAKLKAEEFARGTDSEPGTFCHF